VLAKPILTILLLLKAFVVINMNKSKLMTAGCCKESLQKQGKVACKKHARIIGANSSLMLKNQYSKKEI
jgi:hypothetical protein